MTRVERPSRQIEIGVIYNHSLSSVCLVFEKLPVWMFAFKPITVDHLYIPQHNYFTTLHEHIGLFGGDMSLFDAQVNKIGRRKLIFHKTLDNEAVWLVSGTISHLNDKYQVLRKN